jgi:hypothetical protein
VDFDTSDVELPVVRRRRATTSIPIDDEDMLEPACVWRPRLATGTRPPPLDAPDDAIPVLILED